MRLLKGHAEVMNCRGSRHRLTPLPGGGRRWSRRLMEALAATRQKVSQCSLQWRGGRQEMFWRRVLHQLRARGSVR